mmetsp:Transcript_129302/g.361908  ORF Transcript_129302/g.361908 Transcript_129302/m.361908 type:complete len:320 (+) Transcript_129302:636-1595(+)
MPATGRPLTATPMRTATLCKLPRTNSIVPSSGSIHKQVSASVKDFARSSGTSNFTGSGDTSSKVVIGSFDGGGSDSSSSPTMRTPGNMVRKLDTIASCARVSAMVSTSAASMAFASRVSPSAFLLYAPKLPSSLTSRMMRPALRAKWAQADKSTAKSRRASWSWSPAAMALPGAAIARRWCVGNELPGAKSARGAGAVGVRVPAPTQGHALRAAKAAAAEAAAAAAPTWDLGRTMARRKRAVVGGPVGRGTAGRPRASSTGGSRARTRPPSRRSRSSSTNATRPAEPTTSPRPTGSGSCSTSAAWPSWTSPAVGAAVPR